jgi:hypothetical protein
MRINIVKYAIAERGFKLPAVHFTKIGRNSLIWCLIRESVNGKFLAIPVSCLT